MSSNPATPKVSPLCGWLHGIGSRRTKPPRFQHDAKALEAEPAGLPRTEPAYGTFLGSITQASQCCPARYCHRFGPYNAIDVVDTGRHGPSSLPAPVPVLVPAPSGCPEPG